MRPSETRGFLDLFKCSQTLHCQRPLILSETGQIIAKAVLPATVSLPVSWMGNEAESLLDARPSGCRPGWLAMQARLGQTVSTPDTSPKGPDHPGLQGSAEHRIRVAV